MRAEIISVGTELLLGEITDTNSSYIAGKLPGLGIDLYWISEIGDNLRRLAEALKRAWERSDLIITTGGLGPTEDDLTREAIAQVLGEEMRVDPALEQELRAFFQRRGSQMPVRNIKQVALIPSARAIPNARGTAPGWWVESEGRVIVAMPGPPAEMQHMWETQVTPQLRQRMGAQIILSRTLKTTGIGEATVDEMVSPLLSSANPTLGIYAKEDGIYLRLAAKAASQDQAEELITPMEARLRTILGDSVWGTDDDTLSSHIGDLLRQRSLTLATMESCTGGFLANTITDTPGGSAYFKGGMVSYTNEVKIAGGVSGELIAQHGAVSAEVAQAMASAVRQRLEADIGVGVTGVAGPEELEGKPPGTVHIAVDDGVRKRTIAANYRPGRLTVKRMATTSALIEIRRLLLQSR